MRTHSWEEEVLRRFFHHFDVEEILKIRLHRREVEDVIAWHYERTGLFSVRSAYCLGVNLTEVEAGSISSSSNLDGTRPAWKKPWKLPVPHKVRIFAWMLIQGGLATKCNKKKRTIIQEAICDLCGKEVETEHHAVIRCNHAVSLREAMRENWDIPTENVVAFNVPEWLLLLIDRVDAEEAAQVVLVLWRAWFVRNELTHNGRWTPLQNSVSFLSNYWTTRTGFHIFNMGT